MRRFARYWDMVGNSGRYGRTLKLLIDGPSAFMAFLQFADWLYAQTGKTHKISMERMLRFLFDYLDAHSDIAQAEIAGALAHDYCHSTQHRRPLNFTHGFQKSPFSRIRPTSWSLNGSAVIFGVPRRERHCAQSTAGGGHGQPHLAGGRGGTVALECSRSRNLRR